MSPAWGHVRRRLAELPTWRRRVSFLLGRHTPHWARVVMDETTREYVRRLGVATLDALEISGTGWQAVPFASYRSVVYPDFDICKTSEADQQFDLLILEQVLEHVEDPDAALGNARKLLRPGGRLLVTTPFLVRVHGAPIDGYRWTEDGLRSTLLRSRFEVEETGAWGNRSCVVANLERWVRYRPLVHSLRNDPRFPVVVWAFARRSVGEPGGERVGG